MKKQENEDDEHTPDKEAIYKIYMAGDYGIVAITIAVIGTIFILLFLSQVL